MTFKLTGKLTGLVVIAALLLPSAAMAGIGEELTLAQTHALLAYRSRGAMVKTHLHHVLNCLVGPGGEGYDVTPPLMDPCAGSGKGALADAASPAQKTRIMAAIALTKADLGMDLSDADKMQAAVTDLADAIGTAKD